MRLKESINQNQINLLKAAYGDIKKIDPNSAAVKKLMMVLKKLSKDDLETISKAKINFVSTMAQSILRDSNVSESAEMDNLQKRKNDLLKQVDPLIAKKKKLYSDVDITTPKSSDEKKLDKEIADLFSEINDLVHKIVKLKKSQNEGRNTMKLKLAVTEEIAVGKMVKVVNNPHWEAALGKKGPFKRKVKMIDGDNVFFTDGSNSSMKYVKEDIQPTNEADVNWNAVQNAIINFLKMNTKILDKKVQAKDTDGVKGGLKSIISGLTNAQRSLKLESASRTAMEIGGLTGLNKDAVQKFVDTHNLDIEKVFQFVKKGKLSDRMDFVTAVSGKPNNPIQKKIIKKLQESVNEDTKKRFDVDFYKSNGDRETSHEEIIRGDKFSDVISQATKDAKSKGMNYVEFYHRNLFIGSIDKKSNYTFKKGRDSQKSPLSVNEATNLAKMMAGIKKGSQTGPWTIVVSFNKKVYYQTQVKTKNEIPAKFEHMKKVTNIPGYIFTIEDNTGMTVYSEKLLNEAKKYDIGSGYLGNGLTIWNRAEEKDGDYETIAHIGKDGKLTIYDKEIPADIKKMIGIWATSMKKGNRPGSY
jgi:hypothetical protein